MSVWRLEEATAFGTAYVAVVGAAGRLTASASPWVSSGQPAPDEAFDGSHFTATEISSLCILTASQGWTSVASVGQ